MEKYTDHTRTLVRVHDNMNEQVITQFPFTYSAFETMRPWSLNSYALSAGVILMIFFDPLARLCKFVLKINFLACTESSTSFFLLVLLG